MLPVVKKAATACAKALLLLLPIYLAIPASRNSPSLSFSSHQLPSPPTPPQTNVPGFVQVFCFAPRHKGAPGRGDYAPKCARCMLHCKCLGDYC